MIWWSGIARAREEDRVARFLGAVAEEEVALHRLGHPAGDERPGPAAGEE